MTSIRRPEHKAPPDIFYNSEEAQKYTTNTRMIEIQTTMSERAIELMGLPDDIPCFVLDLGCGSGLSGECLEENGHFWLLTELFVSENNIYEICKKIWIKENWPKHTSMKEQNPISVNFMNMQLILIRFVF